MATNTGNSIMDDIKSGLKGIHGAGEAIRGTVNESVDHAFKDRTGEAKNQAIADQGVQSMKNTDEHFGTHHGLKTGGVGDGTVRTGETTGAGTHSGAPGNLGGSTSGGVVPGAQAPTQETAGTTQRY